MNPRIEELMSAFPDVPKSIILKTEILRYGLQRTPALEEVGKWCLPETHWQFEWDREEHKEEEIQVERHLLPELFQFRDGTTTKLAINSASPYKVKEVDGKYTLLRDDESVEEVVFPPVPKWILKKLKDGTPMSSVASRESVNTFCVNILQHCQYWDTGDECRMCNMGYMKHIRETGRDLKISKTPEQIAEAAFEAQKEEGWIGHVRLSGGSLINRSKETERYVKVILAIKEAIGRKRDTLYGELVSQALDEKDAARAYDTGIEGVQWNMEVWEEKLWPIMVPGKSKFVGRDKWIDCLIKALDFWGEGKVSTSFVAGVETVQPYGFKTVDEAVKSLLGGFEWLLTHGVVPRYAIWVNVLGSRYQDRELPPTEFWLELGQGWHELMKRYGMYPHPTMSSYLSIHKGTYLDFYHLC